MKTVRAEQERMLRKALASAGTISGAARLLGVSRSTVYRWMQRYGIDHGR